MTICIVTDSFPPDLGGIATFYGNLSSILTDMGHHVIVINIDHEANETEADEVISENRLTRVILKKSYKEKYNDYRKFFRPGGLNAPSWISAGISIREWLLLNASKYKIDIIDVCDYGGMGAFLIYDNLPPVVVTGHGSLTQYSRINHSMNDAHFNTIIELEKLSIMHAALILPYSPGNQKDLEYTFHRSIDFATAPWISNQLNGVPLASSGAPLVVAGVQLIKGAELLTQALKEVISKHELKIEWIGMDFHTAQGGTSTAGYLLKNYPDIWNKHMLWRGPVNRETTIQKMADARFIIIPSIFETFSYVALEAATLGKAIIITEGTGAAYLFSHGVNALIVPPDRHKLSEAIMHLQSNPNLCTTLGNNARKMIDQVFKKEMIIEERILAYKKALDVHSIRDSASPDLSFLNKYLTLKRKIYYRFRRIAKKLIKGN